MRNIYLSVWGVLLSSLILYSLLLIFLRCGLVGVVECYGFDNVLYVVDRQLTGFTRYQCWLVHSEFASLHLSLSPAQINKLF